MKPLKKAAAMSTEELAAYIDHSVLKPEFTQEEIRRHIAGGIRYGCATVCINPSALPIAREMCRDTATGICVVCDFPFGLSSTESKVAQAEIICSGGLVRDLDIVANYGWMRSGLWKDVESDIAAVKEVCRRHGTLLKVIFETDALTPDTIRHATEAAIRAGADYIKSSTGFFTGGKSEGATRETVRIMLDAAAGRCKVKASGGIRDRQHFLDLIDMGVDRMGIGYRSTPVLLRLE